MKTFIAELPRTFIGAEAVNQEEFKTIMKDELEKLVEGKDVTIEDISNIAIPNEDEARKSKSKSLLVKTINLISASKNISKATGGIAFLGPNGADVLFNKDICKTLSLVDLDSMSDAGFFSLGKHLTSLSLIREDK